MKELFGAGFLTLWWVFVLCVSYLLAAGTYMTVKKKVDYYHKYGC